MLGAHSHGGEAMGHGVAPLCVLQGVSPGLGRPQHPWGSPWKLSTLTPSLPHGIN